MPYESIFLVKDRWTSGQENRNVVSLDSIEQANIVIDLIGRTLGNLHTDVLRAESEDVNDDQETGVGET